MGNWKWKFWKFSNSMVIKFSNSSSNLFQIHLRNSQKIIETEPTKLLKVKILENQSEFDILTKNSAWNIEKWALKRVKNKRNNI